MPIPVPRVLAVGHRLGRRAPPGLLAPAITGTSVGNELFADDASLAAQLVPALQNIYDALPSNSSSRSPP
jgi:hypothetical protein